MIAAALARGLAAGAAGTTALNVVTYLDMTLRGRPASSVPDAAVTTLAERAGVSLGEGDAAENRTSGAGALLGYLAGLTAGAAYGLVAPVARSLPRPLAGVVFGLGVMAATDASNAALGVSDPREWSGIDWASDVIPHLAYGVVTVAVHDHLHAPR
ncbi:MAG TPA: hypothetical protein VFR97_08320 [Capillimicrobium sp.]|nr:hypothetical protein [Capillimicrobium sp.]